VGDKNVPWWAIAFSIVATETSTLTFISIPGLAYLTNFNFLQITIGYLLGRIVISFIFLPAYAKGNLKTAYSMLETRFGERTKNFASGTFLITQVIGGGVRLFATAIPLAIILKTFSFFQSFSNTQIYMFSILVITIITLCYTFFGGIKGVIWVDVLQMGIYIGGALLTLFIIINGLPEGWTSVSKFGDITNKLKVINWGFDNGLKGFFKEPYTLIGSLLGGCFLSMASHGTDQLIVQRLLTAKNLVDSRKAIITSGIIVIGQFALFLFVGLLLYVFYNGVMPGTAGAPFVTQDEIFPHFIVNYLPVGVKGLILAGLFAAAMSTLAGSISSLSSSTMLDLYKPYFGQNNSTGKDLFISRMITIMWGIVLSLSAFLFIGILQSVVEIALSIASITYGGLLGTFILGAIFKNVRQRAAIIGFASGIFVMLLIILLPIIRGVSAGIHWSWYTFIGSSVTVIVGLLIQKIFKPEAVE
jgi:SSS family transporter